MECVGKVKLHCAQFMLHVARMSCECVLLGHGREDDGHRLCLHGRDDDEDDGEALVSSVGHSRVGKAMMNVT